MTTAKFGNTLLIANPSARNGEGEAIAKQVFLWLREHDMWASHIDMALTAKPGHAVDHAKRSAPYGMLIALGGDGLVHEVINGLMQLAPTERPQLCVVPIGSGNDFAQSLRLAINNPVACLTEALSAPSKMIDLGKVNNAYFAETLSFGLDAAIAIDTIERRTLTGKSGMALYLDSGLRIFRKKQTGYAFSATLDDTRHIEGRQVAFACQNGATYGGGFKICPAANPCDGWLDLCYSKIAPGRVRAISLILRSKTGLHVHSPIIGIERFKKMQVTFSPKPPVQLDGEPFQGETFEIEVVPQAIHAIVGKDFAEYYHL